MKILLLFAMICIYQSGAAQDCASMPKAFNSYGQAINVVKNTRFSIKESVNNIESSWIAVAGFYSCDGNEGFFIFSTNKGEEYIHKAVPIALWRGFQSAESKGSYYDANIKGKYRMPLQ